jgi:branched-chain amino acid transport system substrate-binding protein
MLRRAACALLLPVVIGGCGPVGAGGANDLLLGVMLPLHGTQAPLATQELDGIQIAVDAANQAGGVQGRRLRVATQDVATREATVLGVQALKTQGARVVLGTYSSQLSVPAAHAASSAGLVYWETGAVADQLTGEALPRVFRVGAAGTNLGRSSAAFAAEQLAPRLGKAVTELRITVVQEHDPYGDSVAGAAMAEAARLGMRVAPVIHYDARRPVWGEVLGAVEASRPDILVLASYIPDGVAFRRAMLAANLKVGALIGSTMAECGPEFGAALGDDAIGVFASDRPTHGFNPGALGAEGKTAYDLLAAEYHRRHQGPPTEEAISGFSAAWALVHHVLPAAAGLDPGSIAAAAEKIDLAGGTLPNGAGLRFSRQAAERGQNLRAASVIWQWQGFRRSVTVWPAVFATGEIGLVPLPR